MKLVAGIRLQLGTVGGALLPTPRTMGHHDGKSALLMWNAVVLLWLVQPVYVRVRPYNSATTWIVSQRLPADLSFIQGISWQPFDSNGAAWAWWQRACERACGHYSSTQAYCLVRTSTISARCTCIVNGARYGLWWRRSLQSVEIETHRAEKVNQSKQSARFNFTHLPLLKQSKLL